MFLRSSQGVYRVPMLEWFEWLEHGFGTRLAPQLDLTGVATLRQIHSNLAIEVAGESGCLGEGDALISGRSGSRLGVKTADCFPILLIDERQHAIAAIHAGWRGTVRHIVEKTITAMQARFDARPEDLHAAIGPGIGACCFEVGPEVAREFQSLFPERADLDRATRVDLASANYRQLLQAGIPAAHVYNATLCTVCSGSEFHSFRRDRERAGRMLSWVGIKKAVG